MRPLIYLNFLMKSDQKMESVSLFLAIPMIMIQWSPWWRSLEILYNFYSHFTKMNSLTDAFKGSDQSVIDVLKLLF